MTLDDWLHHRYALDEIYSLPHIIPLSDVIDDVKEISLSKNGEISFVPIFTVILLKNDVINDVIGFCMK